MEQQDSTKGYSLSGIPMSGVFFYSLVRDSSDKSTPGTVGMAGHIKQRGL